MNGYEGKQPVPAAEHRCERERWSPAPPLPPPFWWLADDADDDYLTDGDLATREAMATELPLAPGGLV